MGGNGLNSRPFFLIFVEKAGDGRELPLIPSKEEENGDAKGEC
jgi:hypothetical protein